MIIELQIWKAAGHRQGLTLLRVRGTESVHGPWTELRAEPSARMCEALGSLLSATGAKHFTGREKGGTNPTSLLKTRVETRDL